MSEKIWRSDLEWQRILPPEVFRVTRRKGTEEPFTGRYNRFVHPGTFLCVCCGHPLFSSQTKFQSNTGWPSFWGPVAENHLIVRKDASHGMVREEVLCSRCDAHLGHVFPDGPTPTRLRYCINSVALRFQPF